MLIQGNALQIPLKDECVQCVVTSPPYWGLRDYGTARWEGGELGCEHRPNVKPRSTRPKGLLVDSTETIDESTVQRDCHCGARRIDSQLGLERTPEEYVARMVEVFREVRRVLRDDGTLWLNLGSSYAGSWGNSGQRPELDGKSDGQRPKSGEYLKRGGWDQRREVPPNQKVVGFKPKDMIPIPWMVAMALQADGWYLRSDIIWAKPNPMPESVTDRPTKSHEYLFLLTKSPTYYYDQDAVREPLVREWDAATNGGSMATGRHDAAHIGGSKRHERPYPEPNPAGRNKRTVWTIATQPYPGAHFATFPEKLIEPCILAGSYPGAIVFDPFVGSGTTIRVAYKHQRKAVGLDISFNYLANQAIERSRNLQINMFV